jgi:hypothetical protein
MISNPILANVYRIYYRFYYFTQGEKLIVAPYQVTLPRRFYVCEGELDPWARKHRSFLYTVVPKNIGPPEPWKFKQRHFAFSDFGTSWWCLPSLTPWEWSRTADGKIKIKYGLNYQFVARHQHELFRLRFVAYD